MNPKTLNGQIIGGTVQGLGTALMEEYKYDAEGRVLNADFEYYHPGKTILQDGTII